MLRGFVAGLALVGFAQQATSQTFSADELARRTIERRAVEAVIWGMPAVNYDLMRQAAIHEAKGAENQIVYWSRLPSWKNQTLTPNPDAVYLMPFFNMRAGPMVLEIPPAGDEGSITGAIDNVWQVPLEDVGPAGVDKGKGGKFLILPPAYKDKVPKGYIALPSETYGGFALLRSIVRGGTDADIAKAVAYGKRAKLYPLTQAANPPTTVFVDATNVVFDGTIPYDLSYFQSLDRIVQTEPWLERDKAMIDQLKSLGIEKGKPFSPDPTTKEMLESGAREANAWLDARFETLFSPPYFEATHWALPASPEVVEGMSTDFAKPDSYPVDGRAITHSIAFIGIKHLGAGQFYLMTLQDKDGKALDEASSYRLTVPAKAPITQYWSATTYDRATRAFIRGMERFSLSSQNPDLQVNCDDSVDLYIGPRNPGDKETNWIPTSGEGQFEVLFRFYGPEKPLLEKTWKLPDIEKVAAAGEKFEPTAITCPVTPENFVRAESELNFGNIVKDGGFGKFNHHREVASIENQTVIRLNRDTLYSAGVFDLDAGPVTITLPNAGKRFMSMQVIDEEQYTPEVDYFAGSHTLTREKIGTRYVLVAVRAQVDPDDPKDLEAVHALQDAVKVDQPGGPGKFQMPQWDQASQKTVRDGLLMLATALPDTKGMFGPRGAVDSVRQLIGAAWAWGGYPEKDALYLNVVPAKNEGNTVYRLNVKDVPVDGFWSISVYNANGYFEPNPQNAYTLNNITAKADADGSISVQFGGCDGKIDNCLPTPPDWNYLVRLYRPRPEILDGTWTFPKPQPAN
jgi:hypothetical protein